MIFLSTLFLVIGVASAKNMGVEIVVDLDDSGDVEETASYGWMQRDPTYSDRREFGIDTEGQVRNLLCYQHDDFCGSGPLMPSAVYLTEKELDDRWEKEFDKVGRPDVQFFMSSVEVEVIKSNAKPTVVKKSTMKNSSSNTVTFNTGITSEKSETRSTSWTNTHGFDISQTFSYGIKLLGSGGGGETSFGFSTEWSESEEISRTRTLGSSIGVEVELEPGDGVLVELIAFEGTMTIKTTYEIALEGDFTYVVTPKDGSPNYAEIDSIQALLAGSNMPSKFTVTEVNDVGYYANDHIEVHDLPGNQYLVDFHQTIDIDSPMGQLV